jgi:sec-independent protein translocase protein TatC
VIFLGRIKVTDSDKEEKEMTIMGHLVELRSRFLYILIGMVITTIIGFVIAPNILDYIAKPIGGVGNLQSIEVTESIGVYMRVALLSGVILAMPIIVYELLMFILPGLSKSEKRWVYLAIPVASLLFLIGVLFAYFVMLPAAVPFLVGFLPVKTIIRLSNYIEFVTNIMFWIGLAFESPLLVFVLAKFHIVTGPMLLKQWRIAIVIIAVISAMITPTVDPVNMGLLMLPLTILYFLSVLLAYLA